MRAVFAQHPHQLVHRRPTPDHRASAGCRRECCFALPPPLPLTRNPELDGMKPVHPMTAKAGIILVVLAFMMPLSMRPTAAQIDPRLPEGPNRDLVARKCSACHDLSNLYSTVGRSR